MDVYITILHAPDFAIHNVNAFYSEYDANKSMATQLYEFYHQHYVLSDEDIQQYDLQKYLSLSSSGKTILPQYKKNYKVMREIFDKLTFSVDFDCVQYYIKRTDIKINNLFSSSRLCAPIYTETELEEQNKEYKLNRGLSEKRHGV